MQQMQRADEQMQITTRALALKAQISSIQNAFEAELSPLYEQLAETSNPNIRKNINIRIGLIESDFAKEIDQINMILTNAIQKENTIEMQVKRLDTLVTTLQKQLEKIEEAEGIGIESTIPKFRGLG